MGKMEITVLYFIHGDFVKSSQVKCIKALWILQVLFKCEDLAIFISIIYSLVIYFELCYHKIIFLYSWFIFNFFILHDNIVD